MFMYTLNKYVKKKSPIQNYIHLNLLWKHNIEQISDNL